MASSPWTHSYRTDLDCDQKETQSVFFTHLPYRLFGGKTEQVSGGKKRGVMPEKLAPFHQTVIGRESEFLIEGKHFLHLGMFDCVLLARPPCWSVNVTANKLLPN